MKRSAKQNSGEKICKKGQVHFKSTGPEFFYIYFRLANCEEGMPETLHAREIVVPHVQLHQVSGQKQLFERQETFSKKVIYFK